ncbi:MAG TPA: hypothetical protein VLL05_01495, partial [Terriglobales bacterium]|nr:hypothetical protein [Terriglobales bacterium]
RRGGGLFLLLIFCLLISSASAFSQESAPVPAQASPHHRKRVSLDEQVKGFAKNLDLNDEQQVAVKKILERRQQESLRIMHESSGPDGIDRLRALQTATAEQIRSVLNDEQKKKYNVLMPHPAQASPQTSVDDWMKAPKPH